MRGRLVPVAVAVIAGLALAAFAITRSGEDDAPPAAFPKRTVSAGEIDIELQLRNVDGTGAEVKVVLDGPSGHHREGRLRFDAGGSPDGPIELRLDGFADPVVATWDAGS
jgi:hypothetical protein